MPPACMGEGVAAITIAAALGLVTGVQASPATCSYVCQREASVISHRGPFSRFGQASVIKLNRKSDPARGTDLGSFRQLICGHLCSKNGNRVPSKLRYKLIRCDDGSRR